MRNIYLIAVVATLLGISHQDQTCTSTDHSISSLPYWTESKPFPCMYAGTFNVSDTKNHNLFYWFFKNTSLTAPPLVLWINGGPGASSMFGLFLENGPLRVKKNGTGADDYQIGLAAESWGDYADIIFLD